jgi:GntR family transcriptional regulator
MASAKPKYGMIADQLLRDISAGRPPVGGFLPTENELMRAYGVSRHTVRAAVQDLKSRGIVSSQRGQGSKVIAAQERKGFVETIQSIDELITFGQATRRVLIDQDTVEADAALAELFGCSPGRRFAQARMLRQTLEPDPQTIALVTLWLDALLEPVIAEFEEVQKSAAEIIRNRYGYATTSVVQTIAADHLNAENARALGAEAGDPALVVTRVYTSAVEAEPFLVARSVCKATAFRVVSKFTTRA